MVDYTLHSLKNKDNGTSASPEPVRHLTYCGGIRMLAIQSKRFFMPKFLTMWTILVLVVNILVLRITAIPSTLGKQQRERSVYGMNVTAPYDPDTLPNFIVYINEVVGTQVSKAEILHLVMDQAAYLWPFTWDAVFRDSYHQDSVLPQWRLDYATRNVVDLTYQQAFTATIMIAMHCINYPFPNLLIPRPEWAILDRTNRNVIWATMIPVLTPVPVTLSSNSTSSGQIQDLSAGRRRFRLLVTGQGVPVPQQELLGSIVNLMSQEVWIQSNTRPLSQVYKPHDSDRERVNVGYKLGVYFETLNQQGIQSTFGDFEAVLRELILNDVIKTNPQSYAATAHLINARGTSMVRPFLRLEMTRVRSGQNVGSDKSMGSNETEGSNEMVGFNETTTGPFQQDAKSVDTS